MRRSAASLCAALLLLLAAACNDQGAGERTPTPDLTPTTGATATPASTPTPSDEPAALPTRDPVDLARRLASLRGEVPEQVNLSPPDYAVGHRELFYVIHMASPGEAAEVPPTVLEVWATLQLATPHAYFYVQDGESVSLEDLEKAGQAFEELIYPGVANTFGRERSPGIDNDPRITILHARLEGAAGYFSDTDEYPRTVSPLSNEREMVYLDLPSLKPGGDAYIAVLAHELQHLVHFNSDPDEELWVNEGLSEMAAGLTREVSGMGDSFLARPDTQLNDWDPLGDNYVHYGAADLFCRYLAQRIGGTEALIDLVSEPRNGMAGISAFLHRQGSDLDFYDLFADWVIANYLDEADGLYSYPNLEVAAAPTATLTMAGGGEGTVHQFAADYIEVELPAGEGTFTFDGAETVPVLANEPHSGEGQWWSARGDNIDTTLTRELDLTGLSSATLRFWTWFDIERWYDYGYVEVSTDGGETWQILSGRHTTEDDPVRQAYGPAYTGRSGGGDTPVWVEESMDLTPFAGQRILLRFEYVTDAGINAPGWAIDDIAVPELGLVDDAEDEGVWEARGFQRLTRPLPQRFLVQLIEVGAETRVGQIALDNENRASIELRGFSEGLTKAVIVVAATSEGTTEAAPYEYSLATRP
jgi:immune inhibitor A